MLVLGTIGRWSCGKKNDVGAGDDWTLELWDKSDIGVLGKMDVRVAGPKKCWRLGMNGCWSCRRKSDVGVGND